MLELASFITSAISAILGGLVIIPYLLNRKFVPKIEIAVDCLTAYTDPPAQTLMIRIGNNNRKRSMVIRDLWLLLPHDMWYDPARIQSLSSSSSVGDYKFPASSDFPYCVVVSGPFMVEPNSQTGKDIVIGQKRDSKEARFKIVADSNYDRDDLPMFLDMFEPRIHRVQKEFRYVLS